MPYKNIKKIIYTSFLSKKYIIINILQYYLILL